MEQAGNVGGNLWFGANVEPQAISHHAYGDRDIANKNNSSNVGHKQSLWPVNEGSSNNR